MPRYTQHPTVHGTMMRRRSLDSWRLVTSTIYLCLSVVSGLTTQTSHVAIMPAHPRVVENKGAKLTTRTIAQDRFSLMNRRNILSFSYMTTASIIAHAAFPLPSLAATPSIQPTFPPIAYLEPLYELKLSIDGLVKDSTNPKKYTRMKSRLNNFFKPSSAQPTSEAGLYRIISNEYVHNRIPHDSNMSDRAIHNDKQARQESFEHVLTSLELLKNAVMENKDSVENTTVQQYARQAQRSMNTWFSRFVPPQDVANVDRLVQHIRQADEDRDGKLNKLELESLPEEYQRIWNQRVTLFGSSKVERCLGFKLTETSSY